MWTLHAHAGMCRPSKCLGGASRRVAFRHALVAASGDKSPRRSAINRPTHRLKDPTTHGSDPSVIESQSARPRCVSGQTEWSIKCLAIHVAVQSIRPEYSLRHSGCSCGLVYRVFKYMSCYMDLCFFETLMWIFQLLWIYCTTYSKKIYDGQFLLIFYSIAFIIYGAFSTYLTIIT